MNVTWTDAAERRRRAGGQRSTCSPKRRSHHRLRARDRPTPARTPRSTAPASIDALAETRCVTWTPRAGVELEGSDDLARAHDWLEQADAGPDAPLALQLDALGRGGVWTWCRVRPSDSWGELDRFRGCSNLGRVGARLPR